MIVPRVEQRDEPTHGQSHNRRGIAAVFNRPSGVQTFAQVVAARLPAPCSRCHVRSNHVFREPTERDPRFIHEDHTASVLGPNQGHAGEHSMLSTRQTANHLEGFVVTCGRPDDSAILLAGCVGTQDHVHACRLRKHGPSGRLEEGQRRHVRLDAPGCGSQLSVVQARMLGDVVDPSPGQHLATPGRSAGE